MPDQPTLLRIDTTIQPGSSTSSRLSDLVQATWLNAVGEGMVVRRDIAHEPLPSTLWTEAVQPGAQQGAALATVHQLADELLAADACIIASPLYNWNISQHLKLWIDALLADERLKTYDVCPLQDKPAAMVVPRGGQYGSGVKQGKDFGTPWLVYVLEEVWGMKVYLLETDLTRAHQEAHLAALRQQAEEERSRAHQEAVRIGGILAKGRE